jgi:hypothetical protein
MSVTKRILYKNNSEYIEIVGITDQSVTPPIYVDSLDGVGTLFDGAGVEVDGASSLSAVYMDNGTYRFYIQVITFDPPVAKDYVFIVDLSAGTPHSPTSYKKLHIELPVEVRVRKEGTEL